MTAYSTQGSLVEFAAQSGGFGTAATTGFKDVRVEGEPTVKTPVGTGNRPDTVFSNENDQEKPIVIHQAMDDGMVLGSLIRQPASAGGTSWLKSMFTAGGYTIVSVDDTTVDDLGATAVDFDVATVGSYAAGYGASVEMPDGSYVSGLISAVSSSNLTFAMGFPSVPDNGADVNKALTITPGNVGQITGTDLLTIRANVKAQDGGQDALVVGQDGAVTSLADLNLEPNEKVTIEATFGFSDMTQASQALAANDFADREGGVRLLHEPYAQFATSNPLGGISAAYHKIISATFTWGVTAEQITGFGDTTCNNNIQGWMQKVEPAKLTITMLYDSDKLDDFDGTNASKHVAIIQPGASETDAGWGLFMPKAHIMEAPEAEYYGNNEHRVTVSYTPQPANFNSETSNTQGNQPWYFVINDASA